MGIALEYFQEIMQLGRQFDVFDVVANSFGVGLVAFIKGLNRDCSLEFSFYTIFDSNDEFEIYFTA